MKRISGALLAALAMSVCGASSALADNPVGFYMGAGVGQSTIRSDDPDYGYPGYFNDHHTAWKLIAGVRPISLIGVEYEYIDFGQPGTHRGYYDTNYYGSDSHPRASALFAVGYLPLPVPFFDIYGKVGVARLETDITTTVPHSCTQGTSCSQAAYSYRHDETENKLAYGAGVQSKYWGVTFRAEYERISSKYGDPDALTVGATWTF